MDAADAVTPAEFRQSLTRLPTTLEGVASLPAPSLPVDRWGRWLLVALCRHVERQRWVGQVVDTSLRLGRTRLARGDHGEHPRGRVPGLDDWSYLLDGYGCELTHDSGATLVVDFPDGNDSLLDASFYELYLSSLKTPERVERAFPMTPELRLGWRIDLGVLVAAGLLVRHAPRFALTPDGLAWGQSLAAAFDELDRSADPVYRLALALQLGDPVLAGEVAPVAFLAHRRDAAIDARVRWLEGRLDEEGAVEALGMMGRALAEPVLLDTLERRAPDRGLASAVILVASWQEVALAPQLLAVLERAVGNEAAAPFVRVRAAAGVMEWLGPSLSPSVRERLISALDVPVDVTAGEVGLLLALLDEPRGRQRLIEALGSSTPMARMDAGAALAILGHDAALAEADRWAVPFLTERFERLLARWRPT